MHTYGCGTEVMELYVPLFVQARMTTGRGPLASVSERLWGLSCHEEASPASKSAANTTINDPLV
jgi:hypothetical protein